jgi:CubicO group peptidase (beta-lactamase class C family)
MRPDLAEGLDAFAETILSAGAAASMAAAVTDRNETLAMRAYGQATDRSMFQIGSIGKSFTAIVTLQLAEEGLLDLHAPLTDVLRWFSVGGGHGPITLHHLLTHTAGLITGADIATGSNFDAVELAGTEAAYEPGEHFWYSNVGYRVIGWLLETVTGTGYPQLVRERILERLEMRDSEPWIIQDMRTRLAQAYVPAYDDRPWRREHGLVPATWIDSAEADGCICCTAGDLATYLRAIMNRDSRLLSEASWTAMCKRHVEDDQEGKREHYGYGLAIAASGIGHGGGMIGTYSMMWAGDDGLGAVAMVTGVGGSVALSDAALALARGKEPEPFAVEAAARLNDDGSCPDEWLPFLGHYRSHNSWLTNFRVVAKEGGLMLSADAVDEMRHPLSPLDDGHFRVGKQPWSPERLAFDTVIDGRAQRAWLSGAAYHRTFTE